MKRISKKFDEATRLISTLSKRQMGGRSTFLRHCFLQIFNLTVNICVMKKKKMCGKEKRQRED